MTTTTNTIHSKSNFLTEYEKERNARVMRNELLMRRLGLSDFDSYMHNASSSKNKREEEDDSSDEKKKKKKKKKKEKKRRERETDDVEKVVGVRRSSSRLKRGGGKGETDEQQQEEDKDIKEDKEEEFKERDEEQERKHRIAEQEFSYRNKMKQKKQTIVGTASYQHTLMRVRTMTEPKLRNRMHAISRAKGQHCVTKMRLFARILFLEGYEELAEECAEELSELIGILGDAKDDETREVEEEKVLEEEEEDDENDTNNKENEEEFCKQFHCGQKTNLDDPQIFKRVVDIESHARTMSSGGENKDGEKDEDVYHRACLSMSKGKSGMLDKTGGVTFVLNEDGTYDVVKSSV